MKSLHKSIGTYGENLCVNYLETMGYTILYKNYTCKIGEIDIIAKDNNYICFIEVKSRYSYKYGLPSESINNSKQIKLFKVAQHFILKNNLYSNFFRFDVIEVFLDRSNNIHKFNLIKNAFQINY